MYLSSGIVWWNAVSNVIVFGFPGIKFWHALIPINAAGLCDGANSNVDCNSSITSSVTSTDSLKFPPCAILCPIALISSNEDIAGYSGFNNCLIEKSKASLWFDTGCCNTIFSPFILCVRNDASPILSYLPEQITDSSSMFINWYFNDELPQLITNTFIFYSFFILFLIH